MDPTSYAAPARVKSLVLPVGTLKIGHFDQYYARLVQASEVQLIDVHLPTPKRDETALAATRYFNPQANPTGRLTFDFETSQVDEYLKPLMDLEPWRQQFMVVGIAHYSAAEAESLETSIIELRRRYSSFLYHVVLVFGVPPDAVASQTDASSAGAESQTNLKWPASVYPIMKSNLTSLESTLSTVAAEFLVRLSKYWSTRHLSSFKSPSELVGPTAGKRHNHSASAVTIGKHGSISMGSTERAKSRQEGRSLKYLGTLYLLIGLIPDALAELGAAATILKDQGDHLWLGSALSEIALCLVMLKYEGVTAGTPSVAVSAAWAIALQRLKKKSRLQNPQHARVPDFSKSSTTSTSVSASAHRRQASVSSTAGSTGCSYSGSMAASASASTADSASASVSSSAAASAAGSPTSDQGHLPQDPHDQGSHMHPTMSAESNTDRGDRSSPRSSLSLARVSSLRKSKPFNDQTPLEDIIEYIQLACLDEFGLGQDNELVPHTVYYQTIARFVNLLICLRQGWSTPALAAALRPHEYTQSSNSGVLRDDTKTPISEESVSSIIMIESWICRVYDIALHELGPDSQARILGTVAQLYAKAGLKRKWAFACAQIVSLLASSRTTMDASLGHVEDVLQTYSKWPKLEASMLRNLVALGQRIQNPRLQTEAASRLLSMVCKRKNVMLDKEQMTMYHLIRSYGDVVQSPFWDPGVLVNATVKTHKLTTVRTNSSHRHSLPSSDAGTSGGIIYNPFEGTEFREEGSIERGIPTNTRIMLRNPLAIDISVFELALVNARGEFVSEVVKDVAIPALATSFRVEAQVLPEGDEPELEIMGCYIQISGCLSEIVKLSTPIKIPVIPARPVLVLQSLSLMKGWTMLLEGECQKFSLELWNSSVHTPSNVLHFGFNDSTVDPLRQAASKQDVSRADFYEYEYFLHHRRAIDISGEPADRIDPRTSQKFEFNLFGKRGVNSAAILVDYGNNEDSLRRLKIPLQVTICPSVSVDGVNILPTNSSSAVILVLDLRNMWRERLECTIWADGADHNGHDDYGHHEYRADGGTLSERITQSIDPGSLCRFFIRMPWEPLTFEEMRKPIPSFSKRQFTVDTKTTPERLQSFWLRERLLSKLHGEWTTNGRSGYVELRTIQLSRRMTEVLKTSVVEVKAKPLSTADVDEPTALVIKVENKSSSPIEGMLRLIPNKAAIRYMLVLGVNQQRVLVPAEQSIEVTFQVIFLSHGPFELSSVLDPINAGPGSGNQQPSVFQANKTIVNV